MSSFHGTVINYVYIISDVESGRGGKGKSSYRGHIVNLEIAGDNAFMQPDTHSLLTLSRTTWSINAFVCFPSAWD